MPDSQHNATAILQNRAPSLAHLFRHRAAISPDEVAYQFFRGESLQSVTWSQTRTVVWAWAAGLAALGVEPQDRVAIASATRYEWALADLAVMCAGAATTTVYPNTMAADVAYLIGDAGCRVVFAEDAAQVAKLREHRAEIPTVTRVVCFDAAQADHDWVISSDELARLGAELLERDPGLVDERIDALTPEHLATIIYTSGTTGRPKGAELTHDAFTYVAAAADAIELVRRDDLQFLWLPLSHVFGKVLLAIPMQVGFPTAIDGRQDRIVDNLAVIKPTWMGAAPRVFEKAKAKVAGVLDAETSPVKRSLAAWAMGVGRQVAEKREHDESLGPLLQARFALADRLVLAKVRERFGGRIRFLISGSAPLDADVARWFAGFGLVVCEGYGLTETAAFSSVNQPHPGGYIFGSIGQAAPGTEITIAADGEILIEGPGVMRGYHGHPEATAAAFTDDGRFRTGDLGEIDDRGFIRITGRKKEVLKTSGGKYIAPGLIEAHFKGLCPYVSQFVVLGDARNYASALVTLDAEAITAWAAEHGMAERSYAEIVASPEARDLIQGYVDELNSGLNRWETIKRFAILERDLTVEDEELTPSMKLRRSIVMDHFAPQVQSLYPDH